MENPTTPTQTTPISISVKKPINKWSLASLLTLTGGVLVILLISLGLAISYTSLHSTDQVFYSVLGLIILPIMATITYSPAVAVFSLVLAIVGLVKAQDHRNVLGIVATVISGLLVLGLPNFFNTVL